jgi:hypothetical protein
MFEAKPLYGSNGQHVGQIIFEGEDIHVWNLNNQKNAICLRNVIYNYKGNHIGWLSKNDTLHDLQGFSIAFCDSGSGLGKISAGSKFPSIRPFFPYQGGRISILGSIMVPCSGWSKLDFSNWLHG